MTHSSNLFSLSLLTIRPGRGRGRGRGRGKVLPINELMGMCRRMWSPFHDWIDYNGVASSTKFPTELLEWGRKLSEFLGVRKFYLSGI